MVRPIVTLGLSLHLCLYLGALAAEDRPAVPGAYKSATGPFAVETVERVTLQDARRHKELRVFVSYPKGTGPFPVIVFSHGALGSGDAGFLLVNHWTSHGYVVLCPTHADSAKLRREQGALVADVNPVEAIRNSGRPGSPWDPNWLERPRDISFVIDSLGQFEQQIPALKGRLDRQHIAVAGHSLGAYTAQVVSGATVIVPGKVEPQSLADPRLKAVLQISGQGTNQQGLHRGSWDNLRLPMMCLTGSLDRAVQGQEPEWRREPFEFAPPGDKYFVFLEGAHHGSFLGRTVERPAMADAGAARLQALRPEERERVRQRFLERAVTERATKSKTNPAPKDSPNPQAPTERRGIGGSTGNQKEIFDWARQATTAFWDAYLRDDLAARAWLASDSLSKLSTNKARLEAK